MASKLHDIYEKARLQLPAVVLSGYEFSGLSVQRDRSQPHKSTKVSASDGGLLLEHESEFLNRGECHQIFFVQDKYGQFIEFGAAGRERVCPSRDVTRS
jgi:hypothetical protein